MATTLQTFYDNYNNLAVTGVTSLDESPLSAPSVKLPCKWIDSIGIDEAQLRAKGVGGDRTFRCRVVVLVAAHGQDLHTNRWSDSITMVDTLNAALKTVAAKSATFTINVAPNFAEQYFAVVADITENEGMV